MDHLFSLYDLSISIVCWNKMIVFFLEISCGVPPVGVKTDVPSGILLYQGSYNYSCLDGYETKDRVTTECLANGSLSLDNPPNCTSKYELFLHLANTAFIYH